MHDSIFREYDIRGKVGSELIIDEVYNLGCALAYYFLKENPHLTTVAIGMDGRLSGIAIKNQLTQAFMDSGLRVIFIGVCPTPVLYFATHTMAVDAGIMITASHNPKEYNGIKLVLNKQVVWGVALQEIAALYRAGKKIVGAKKGSEQDYPLVPAYISWLADHFSSLKGMNLAVVIDCGNGATGTIVPALIKAMAWPQITVLYPEVDGTYPNHEADPVVEENMQDVKHILATTAAVVGIGLDGDGDRMAAMTKDGFLVPGDQLLALFAQQVLQENPGACVVFDVKVSAGLIELLEQWKARPIMSPAGHAIIKDRMKKNSAVLGGELSCHFFFHDRYFGYDDGIYAMMRLFEILCESRKGLEESLSIFPQKVSTREVRLACPEEKKQEIVAYLKDFFTKNAQANIVTLDGIRVTMPYGWGLVRASNTQAVLSMRFESDSRKGLQKIQQDFIVGLSHYFPSCVLHQYLNE